MTESANAPTTCAHFARPRRCSKRWRGWRRRGGTSTSRRAPACAPEAERLLAEIDHPATTHYRRTEIGDRLASIGDSRSGVGLRANGAPDIDWCQIPGGTVELEGGRSEFRVKRFFIARYPLTWQQYQAFIADP